MMWRWALGQSTKWVLSSEKVTTNVVKIQSNLAFERGAMPTLARPHELQQFWFDRYISHADYWISHVHCKMRCTGCEIYFVRQRLKCLLFASYVSHTRALLHHNEKTQATNHSWQVEASECKRLPSENKPTITTKWKMTTRFQHHIKLSHEQGSHESLAHLSRNMSKGHHRRPMFTALIYLTHQHGFVIKVM